MSKESATLIVPQRTPLQIQADHFRHTLWRIAVSSHGDRQWMANLAREAIDNHPPLPVETVGSDYKN